MWQRKVQASKETLRTSWSNIKIFSHPCYLLDLFCHRHFSVLVNKRRLVLTNTSTVRVFIVSATFSFFSRTSLVPYGVWVPCVLDCDRADIYVRTNFLQSWLAFYWEVEMKEQITLLVNEDTMIEGVQGRDWFWGIGFGTFMDGSGELV